jgi:hypothetical protein
MNQPSLMPQWRVLLPSALLLLSSAGLLPAASLTATNFNGSPKGYHGVASLSGTLVTSAPRGALGRMKTLTDQQIADLIEAGNLAALNDDFEVFGQSFALNNILPGAFEVQVDGDTRAATQPGLGGSTIYLWISSTADRATSSQFFLARLNLTFPTDPERGIPETGDVLIQPSSFAQVFAGEIGTETHDYGIAGGAALPLMKMQTIDGEPEPAEIFLSNLHQIYNGDARPVFVSTYPAGLPRTITYDGNLTPPVLPGRYEVAVEIVPGGDFVGSVTATLIIDHRFANPIENPDDNPDTPGADPVAWDSDVVGRYDGLLVDQDDGSVLGAIESLTVTRPARRAETGRLTGRVRINGSTFVLRGLFAIDGEFTRFVTLKDGSGLTLTLRLNRTDDGNEVIRGEVEGDDFVAVADLPRAPFSRRNPAPESWVGPYTMLIPGNPGSGIDEAGGDGWAVVTLTRTGLVRVRGVLGDGTTLTENGFLSAHGEFSIFRNLYRAARRGWVGGKMTLRDEVGVSDFDGPMYWLKPKDDRQLRYPDGFEINLTGIGSRYVRPALGTIILSDLSDNESNASLILIGANLPEVTTGLIECPVTWLSNNRLTHSSTVSITGSAQRNTGRLTGQYRDRPESLSIRFRGVAFQKQGMAAGTFVRANQGGAVRIVAETN